MQTAFLCLIDVRKLPVTHERLHLVEDLKFYLWYARFNDVSMFHGPIPAFL